MKYCFNMLPFLFMLLTASSLSAWSLIIDDEEPPFGGADYEGWEIEEVYIDQETKLYNCNFKNAKIQKAHIFWAENCDFTDTWFGDGIIELSREDLLKTRNFKGKEFPLSVNGDLSNLDLSSFYFHHGDFSSMNIKNSQMKNVIFQNCRVPYMTNEQWKQTRNYAVGDYRTLRFSHVWENIDLSRTVWGGISCRPLQHIRIAKSFHLEDEIKEIPFKEYTYSCSLKFTQTVNLTDALFINCDLSSSTDLTLEQVKSTWNYKAGRMSLCKWPEHIEKALEEEEKAKAQEEKK
ncbi:MAG: hypothetical protein IJD43_13510 [Thermoguttaceae bacterium]|nr:hypothetical protein [Thermoguttaceae bacterium]